MKHGEVEGKLYDREEGGVEFGWRKGQRKNIAEREYSSEGRGAGGEGRSRDGSREGKGA